MRRHLLALACDTDVAAALVDALTGDDVAACEGLPDDTLRTYLRALERDAVMDRAGYTHVAHCKECGPIWWHRAECLVACPWCRRQRVGLAVPRPL